MLCVRETFKLYERKSFKLCEKKQLRFCNLNHLGNLVLAILASLVKICLNGYNSLFWFILLHFGLLGSSLVTWFMFSPFWFFWLNGFTFLLFLVILANWIFAMFR